MADITYIREFDHKDWIDNQDVVQAGGPTGFNQKFHSLENEFDRISTVVGIIDTEIKKIQRLNFLVAQSPFPLNANTVSAEFAVETYDRAALPPNVEKIYSVVILPAAAQANTPTSPPANFILHTFYYRTLPGNKMQVTVQFFNPCPAPVTFAFRVMTLATQA